MSKFINLFNFGSPVFILVTFYFFFHILKLVYYYFYNITPDGLEFYFLDNFILLSTIILSLITYYSHRSTFKYLPPSRNYLYRTISNTKSISANVLYFTFGSIILLLALGFNSGILPWNDPLSFREIIQGNGGAYFMITYLFFFKASGCYFFDAYLNKLTTTKDYIYILLFILFSFMSGFASLFVHFFIVLLLFFIN